MSDIFRFFLLLFFLGCFGLVPNASIAQDEGPLRVRVDVDMVTIEVTALDKKDNPVPNLKREDFDLYEDGKKQDIISLDEIAADSGASALGASPISGRAMQRGKSVFILFDDSDIEPLYIKSSRDTAERFVRENMRPQDLFAVAQYDMSLKILQNFTSEKAEVLAAIRRPAGSSPGSALYFENLLRALEKICQAIAPIRGQKTILIYSQSGFTSSYTSPTMGNTYATTLTAAKKSNTVIYTLSPENLGSSSGSMGAMPVTMGGGSRGLGAISSLGAAVTLRSLATESGGFSIYNTNNFDNELDKFDQQLSNYYILGFQSRNPKHDGGFRKIEIKTKTKGVTLKYRPGYQDRRPVDVLASSRQEKILQTALATPSTATQLPIGFRPAYFYDSLQSARVLIAARLQMDKVALKKKGGQLETDLNIMGVAYAEDSSVAARFSETMPIGFAKEQEAEFRKSALPYRSYFKLRPGKYRLKLAASDEANNLGAAEQSLEIPVPNAQGFAASSLVIAEQLSQLPDLIRNLQTQLLDQSDPLLFSQMQIEPSIANRLPANTPVAVLFRIYNLAGPLNQLNLVAKTRLLDEKGERFALAPIPLKEIVSPAGPSEIVVALRLPLQGVPAGKYRLAMEISETGTGQSATIQTDLELY